MLLYLRYFLCGLLSYRACVCVLIDGLNCRIPCSHHLLYTFRGQQKIIPQYSRSKSSTKPPSPFLTCQFKMATRPLLFSRHPIPSAIAKYTPYEPYTTYFDRPLQSTVFTTALIRLRRLKRQIQNSNRIISDRWSWSDQLGSSWMNSEKSYIYPLTGSSSPNSS